MICLAKKEEKAEILQLYRSMLYGPADWNENYPNEDTIDFDLSRDALIVMKNESGEILAAISIDDDPEVAELPCWNPLLAPGAELARLAVREDMRNKGVSKQMMKYAFRVLRAKGMKSVHILVKTGHIVALTSYSHLGFEQVGKCELFGKSFVCMEIRL